MYEFASVKCFSVLCVCVLHLLIPIVSMNSDAPPKTAIRLVGGANGSDGCEGRVEVFVNGQWGTVCDDSWSLNNSNVVCRELGFPSAIASFTAGSFWRGEGSIWLDDVRCMGQEASLLLCSHSNIGESDCTHTEDIVVKCNQTGEDGSSVVCSKCSMNVHTGVFICYVHEQ